MRYPKECFCINENVTENAKREYELKKKLWYDKAEELYPNYWDLDLREKYRLRDEISNAVGFRI